MLGFDIEDDLIVAWILKAQSSFSCRQSVFIYVKFELPT